MSAVLTLTLAMGLATAVDAAVAAPAPADCPHPLTGTLCEYAFTGADQYFTVPAGITAVEVRVEGAGTPVARGGRVTARLAVVPGERLVVTVGETSGSARRTYGGGGAGSCGTVFGRCGTGGAGLSGIWRGRSFSVPDALLIAGGAGGGGPYHPGGAGGGDTGGDGGGGRTPRAACALDFGGSGGGCGGGPTAGGSAGYQAAGGARFSGGAARVGARNSGGGGGGGGWFGGGGGTGSNVARFPEQSGGGGGGSGYTGGAGVSGATSVGGGAASDAGRVYIEFRAGAAAHQWATAVTPSGPAGIGQARDWAFGSSGLTAHETVTDRTAAAGASCAMGTVVPDLGAVPAARGYLAPDVPLEPAPAAANTCSGAARMVTTVTFSRPVLLPRLHVAGIDGSSLEVSGQSSTGRPLTLTAVSGNAVSALADTTINPSPRAQVATAGCQGLDGSAPSGACGSFEIGAGSGAVSTLTLTVRSTGTDVSAITFSFPSAQVTATFAPTAVHDGERSVLTLALVRGEGRGEADLSPLGLTVDLPAGVAVADPATVGSRGCGAVAVTDAAGGGLDPGESRVAVAGATVASGATCTVEVGVTAAASGAHALRAADLAPSVANVVVSAAGSLSTVRAAMTVAVGSGAPVDVNRDGLPDAGDTIAYSYTVTNKGEGALTGVRVVDGRAVAVTCPSSSLEPGRAVVCTATYTVSAADEAAGAAVATASATGTSPLGRPVASAPSTTRTSVTRARAELTLSITPSRASVSRAGDTVDLALVVQNSGNVPVESIALTTVSFSGAGAAPEPSCAGVPSTLPPGAAVTCTASYTVVRTDLRRARLDCSAVVRGSTAATGPLSWSASRTIVVVSARPPSRGAGRSGDAEGSAAQTSAPSGRTGGPSVTPSPVPGRDEASRPRAGDGTTGEGHRASPSVSGLPSVWIVVLVAIVGAALGGALLRVLFGAGRRRRGGDR